MACGSTYNPNSSQDLVINELRTWDLFYVSEEIRRPSATICNPPAWITQPFSSLQKAQGDVRLLAEASEEEHVMEIDISKMHNYYKTPNKN
jgi:hypothetical protein